MGYETDYPKPEKTYFGQLYNALEYYSPGGKIVDGKHYIQKSKILRVENYESVIQDFNKRDDILGGVKEVVIVE